MELAAEISAQRLARKVDRKMRVLIDRIEDDAAIARSASDAPEIDGTVRIEGGGRLKVGEFADVRITRAGAYDLEARLDSSS
jgi:ribosomal protein S12 methylthiotransferase